MTLALLVEMHESLTCFPNGPTWELEKPGMKQISVGNLLTWISRCGLRCQLEHFELTPEMTPWTPHLLSHTADLFPRRKYLGTIRSRVRGLQTGAFEQVLTTLQAFKHLKTLSVSLNEHLGSGASAVVAGVQMHAPSAAFVVTPFEEREEYALRVCPKSIESCGTLEEIWMEGGRAHGENGRSRWVTASLLQYRRPRERDGLELAWTPRKGRDDPLAS